jgi:hypothetical protein
MDGVRDGVIARFGQTDAIRGPPADDRLAIGLYPKE